MDNNQSSSVPTGQGRVRRIINYVTGALGRRNNRVAVTHDNRPLWIQEDREPNIYERSRINAGMMAEEDRQRNTINNSRDIDFSRDRYGRRTLLRLTNENLFEGQTHLETLPPDVINNIYSFISERQPRLDTVLELGDRLDWNNINT